MRSMLDPLIHTKKAKAGDDTYNLSMAFLSVEAKPLISTTGKHMEKFIWEHMAQNTSSHHLSLSPPSKWAGQGHQEGHHQRNGAKTGKDLL
ncbi:hypothetical protein Tco_0284726, partial [Tanacetum coccineum]